MMKLKVWLSVLATFILVWAKTSASQEFLNERPKSNNLLSKTDTMPFRTQMNSQGQPQLRVCTKSFVKVTAVTEYKYKARHARGCLNQLELERARRWDSCNPIAHIKDHLVNVKTSLQF